MTSKGQLRLHGTGSGTPGTRLANERGYSVLYGQYLDGSQARSGPVCRPQCHFRSWIPAEQEAGQDRTRDENSGSLIASSISWALDCEKATALGPV